MGAKLWVDYSKMQNQKGGLKVRSRQSPVVDTHVRSETEDSGNREPLSIPTLSPRQMTPRNLNLQQVEEAVGRSCKVQKLGVMISQFEM